jgi:hypothetical protein
MKKTILLASCVALLALVLVATPAMAQSFDFDNNDFFDDNGFFFNDNDFDNDSFDDNGFFGFGGFDQETDETGDVTLDTSIISSGDNSNQTAAPLQFGNTGNFQNAQGFSSFGSSADDIDFDGGSFEFSPTQGVGSNQGVFQSSTSSR